MNISKENVILKEKIGKKRIILSDEQRRKLAVLAKRIGRNGLSEICDIFSPETLEKKQLGQNLYLHMLVQSVS